MSEEAGKFLLVDGAYVRWRLRRDTILVGISTVGLAALGLVSEYASSPGKFRAAFENTGATLLAVLVACACYVSGGVGVFLLMRSMLRQRHVAVFAGWVRVYFGTIRAFRVDGGRQLIVKRDGVRGLWIISSDISMRGSTALPIRAFPALDTFLKSCLLELTLEDTTLK